MANRIILRNGTASEWSTHNPVLEEGEVGLELDTGKMKIGDGTSSWHALNYANDDICASYGSQKDDNGVYKVIEYYRPDDTLYMKSTLSNPNSDEHYQTMTWQYYNGAGTSIVRTLTWTITYDDDGGIISKVVV